MARLASHSLSRFGSARHSPLRSRPEVCSLCRRPEARIFWLPATSSQVWGKWCGRPDRLQRIRAKSPFSTSSRPLVELPPDLLDVVSAHLLRQRSLGRFMAPTETVRARARLPGTRPGPRRSLSLLAATAAPPGGARPRMALGARRGGGGGVAGGAGGLGSVGRTATSESIRSHSCGQDRGAFVWRGFASARLGCPGVLSPGRLGNHESSAGGRRGGGGSK